MIKLKSILYEVLAEARRKGGSSGEYEYTIEIDGKFIPALSHETEVIEISTVIYYDLDPGSPATGMFGPPEHSSPGEGPSVEITGHDIVGMTIHPAEGESREVDVRFLHPRQREVIEKLVEADINKNSRNIEDNILNGAID